MKRFACGDVVPGCDATFVGESDDDLLVSVAQHAADTHGVADVPPEMVDQVRRHIAVA